MTTSLPNCITAWRVDGTREPGPKKGKTYSLASLSTMVSNLRSKFIKTGHQSIDCYMSSLALRKFMHLEEAGGQ